MNEIELKQALAAVAQEAGLSKLGKSKFAELIIEIIQPNRLTLDVFSAFLPTRQLNIGDSLIKRTSTYGMPVRTMVPGTNHLADQLSPPREVLSYVNDTIIAKLRYSLLQIQQAELFTLEQMREEMKASLVDTMVAKLFSLVGSVWNATDTPSNFTTVTGQVTESALEDMMETVLLQAGNIRAIVGTRKALLPVYKFAGLYEQANLLSNSAVTSNPNVIPIPNILEEWRRTGRLTSFRGSPLIELPQVFKRTYDAFDTKLLRDDQVIVIGDNAGEAVLYGDAVFQDYTDFSTEPPEYAISAWRSYGVVIDWPERIGIIKIN